MPVRTIKRRYIAFSVKKGYDFTRKEVLNALPASILESRGSSDFRKRGLRLIMYDRRYGVGIIRCGHRDLGKVKSFLIDLKEISGRDVTVRVIGVSGTLKALKRKFLTKLKEPLIHNPHQNTKSF